MSMTRLQTAQNSAVQFARSCVSLQSVVGAVLILCGGLADGAAGWLAFSQEDGWSLLIHIPAILVWGIGLCALQRADISNGRSAAYTAPSERSAARVGAPIVPRWVMVFMLLGAVVFPGLVPAAWCIAYAFTRTRIRTTKSHAPYGSLYEGLIPLDAPGEQWASRLTGRAMEQPRYVDAEPLVDAIHDPDSELRRGAIAALGKQGDRNAVRLIRSMLKDPNPDVRSDASVALARLESTFARAISEAEARFRWDPAAAKDYADLCYQYATNDLLDETSNHLYLVKSKVVLREFLEYRLDNVDAWVLMARIHSALAETAEAMTAVQRALALDTQTQEIVFLGAELAFRQQDWAMLRALAIRACTTLQHQDERYEIMRWWARIPSKPRRDDPLSEPAFHPTTSPRDEAGNATLLERVESGKGTI